MTLRNILEKTAEMLGITADFDAGGDTETLLEKCGRDVLCQLAEEYAEIKTEENFTATDLRIAYSAASKPLKRIISVSKDGEKRKFCEFNNYAAVPENGVYTVVYSFLVKPAAISKVVDLPPKYTLNILAAGAAGEFCFRKGLFKEAESYRGRYIEALENADRCVKDIVTGRAK